MKISLHKLTQKGFISHHIIIPAVVVVVGIGGVGAYVLNNSNAAPGISCSVTFTPSWPKAGTSVTASYTFKNNSGSYWSGSTTPKLRALSGNRATTYKTVYGSLVNGLAPSQTTTRNVSMAIPSSAKGGILDATDTGGSCYRGITI